MRLLLDTHTLAWAVGQPALLSKKAKRLLESPETSILISPVSLWEMSIKHKQGRWPELTAFLDGHLYASFLM